MSKLHSTLAALYLAAAIITFGRAAAQSEKESRAEYAECQRQTSKYGICYRSDIAAGDGFVAAALWPLYWSWEAWT